MLAFRKVARRPESQLVVVRHMWTCALCQWLPFCVFQTLTDVSECLSLQPLPGSQYPYNYAGHMGYWYPQGYPAQVQGQQFLGMQGFAYGQYGYQQG